MILAADSTVSEGQTSYKWASPVSMPEDAARRFAVVSKVEPIYNENVAVWSITLEAVTKSAAEAGETGALPYSDASSPEEGSNYYTYAGDMSPEDHERMAEEINQDRARLAEVQDRIIQLDSLRRELDRRAAPPEEYVPIGEEGLAIMKEEADLRNALEDAGAPAPTTADHAREKLATIRSRRGEIAAAGQKDQVFEDLDGEEENLAADGRYLTVLFRVIDAGAPGLPKGFYTSPWLSHFLLTPFDNYITQTLQPDHYLRYADNIFLFYRNKKKLHQMVRDMIRYLWEKLRLCFKGDWQVFRFESENRRAGKVTGRAVNCLGFVIHRDRVTMRKSILERARAKANRIKRNRRTRRIDAAAIISYMGWFKHTDTYGYYLRWIKPKVSVKYCKRRIAAHAKKKNRKGVKTNDRLEKGPGQPDGRARRAGHNLQHDNRI